METSGCWQQLSLAIRSDETLWSWGYGANGNLGLGGIPPIGEFLIPTKVGSDKWSQVAANWDHSLGIKLDGTLWAWGFNGFGKLGDGTTSYKTSPIKISSDSWLKVAAGWNHSLGIKSDGTLWAWGRNNAGQLGNNTLLDSLIPIKISSDYWNDISTGGDVSLAIKADGTLWAWGGSMFGLGDGATNNAKTPTLISFSEWSKISAGYSHVLALKSDSTLWAWGYNYWGQIGDGSSTNSAVPKKINISNVERISAGYMHSHGIVDYIIPTPTPVPNNNPAYIASNSSIRMLNTDINVVIDKINCENPTAISVDSLKRRLYICQSNGIFKSVNIDTGSVLQN